MTSREELIEEARVAFVDAWEAERKKIGRGIAKPGAKTRAGIVAALAVFEQAHTPTVDEREALRDELAGWVIGAGYYQSMVGTSDAAEMADAILAAGFRRTVQGEPTDAEVEAAARVLLPEGLGPWEKAKPEWQARARRLALSALRAAAATQEGENRG